MRKNLALLAVSTLLTLVGLEAALRAGWVERPAYFESSGWWRENWLAKRRGPVPKAFVKLDPDLGWVEAPDLDRVEYQGAELSTNSRSLRGRREHRPGRADHPRIVAVGDSFMFGQCLDDAATIPARLEQDLPGSEVINLGVMGYGHGQMLSRLRRDGLVYEPDVVLLGFVTADMSRNRLSFRDYAKPRYRLRDGKLVLTNVPVGEPDDWEGGLRIWNFAGMLWDAARPEALAREEVALTGALLDAMAADARRVGAHFAVIQFPSRDEVEEETGLPYFVEERCVREEWLCMEPGERIRAALPNRRIRKDQFDCHYSPRLAALVAEEAAAGLRGRWPDLFD